MTRRTHRQGAKGRVPLRSTPTSAKHAKVAKTGRFPDEGLGYGHIDIRLILMAMVLA